MSPITRRLFIQTTTAATAASALPISAPARVHSARTGEFTHLHLHTEFSIFDSLIRLDDLFPRVLDLGMKQVAITDHGNLFGAMEFERKARLHGVKPIFGCEAYVVTDRFARVNRRNHRLVLLAKDNIGWKNLSYLNSMGYVEGFYYKPRIDKRLLREHSQGLLGLSSGLEGEVAQTLLYQGPAAAEAVAREFKDIFGAGNFFLELQPAASTDEESLNGQLVEMSRRTGIPLIATNDCHYLDRVDARTHRILGCVREKRIFNDARPAPGRADAFLKSAAEMDAHFKHLPQAMENAALVGDMCNVTFDFRKKPLPTFQAPGTRDPNAYLRDLAQAGLRARLEAAAKLGTSRDSAAYEARLATELDVVGRMLFSNYFLIVWDYVKYARERGIAVGPGRGSAAGSLLAYALQITDIDPIEYELIFERFLNPERILPPDFDVDFCADRVDEVVAYVTRKYGRDHVGHLLATYKLKGRGCVRDVARAFGLTHSEAARIADLVPEISAGVSPPLRDAMESEPRLQDVHKLGGRYQEVLDVAMTLEGLPGHIGICRSPYADPGVQGASLVMGAQQLWDYVPCARFPHAEESPLVTQFDGSGVDRAGLVTFDFLGLEVLTVIQRAANLVNLDISAVPLDDARVYQMLSAGDAADVFLCESPGFGGMLRNMRPTCFNDLAAAVALYRPGPIESGMADDFIRRKHGRGPVAYMHPMLEPILKDTYGVIIYQEQIMQMAATMAGYPLGAADLLRRAMGKRNANVLDKENQRFVAGAASKGIDPRVAEKVFDLMEHYTRYAFNRSHAVAYGLLTYQPAYLKCHHPAEFAAASAFGAEYRDLAST